MLHEFLLANRAAIIGRTRAKVAVRTAPVATEAELENGIPLFLDQLIAALHSSHPSTGGMAESATKHGGDLLKRGFTVAQVVYDYGGVCQAVTELATEMNAAITPAEFHVFNRCLDEAIALAVTEYGRSREKSLTDEGTERMGDLSHELRNALGAAMLSFQVIKTGSVGLGGSTAAVLDRSLRRAIALIESSVARIRFDSGIRSAERVPVLQFIEEIEVGAHMEATARGLTLAVTPVAAGLEVKADRQLLAAAVANLLQNAFKFSRPHGQISLKTSSNNNRILIEVEDECGGLPPGKADELFHRFEQRSSDRTGMGLGLAISRKSVQADGGEIRVRDIPGIGCVFTIDLPRLSPMA